MTVSDLDVLEQYVLRREADTTPKEVSPTLAAKRVIANVEGRLVDMYVAAGVDVDPVAIWGLKGAIVCVENIDIAYGDVVAVLKMQRPIRRCRDG